MSFFKINPLLQTTHLHYLRLIQKNYYKGSIPTITLLNDQKLYYISIHPKGLEVKNHEIRLTQTELNQEDLINFQNNIGVYFKDPQNLKKVFIISQEHQKLEMIGDVLLDIFICEFQLKIGPYSSMVNRKEIISNDNLSMLGHTLNINNLMSKVLAVEDCIEVLIAVIFKDQGPESTRNFIKNHLLKNYKNLKQTDIIEYKTPKNDPKINQDYQQLEKLLKRSFKNETMMKEALNLFSPLGNLLTNIGYYVVKLCITTELLTGKYGYKFSIINNLRDRKLENMKKSLTEALFPEKDLDIYSNLSLSVIGALYLEEGLKEFNGVYDFEGNFLKSTLFGID